MQEGEQRVLVFLDEVDPDAHGAPIGPGDPGDVTGELNGLGTVGWFEADQDSFPVPERAIRLCGEPSQSQIDDLCAHGAASPVSDNDRSQSHRKPLMRSVIPLPHTDPW
jgi:hypothetical protein